MQAQARIAVLDAALADQIAAGEVVERPASALKELLDNAVDAQATRIEVEIQEGGKQMISVRDNGCGMHPEDLPLCVLRHATSKIRSADQLLSLQTLGFRGEALASLAAVARVAIKSRRPGDDLGSSLVARPGRSVELSSVGMPLGTQVEISELFSQVPARLKFLRAEATESAHCVEAVVSVALLHPEIAFFLRSSGKSVLEFPATDAGGRVAQVLSRRAPGPFVAFEDEHEGVRVQGWLAPLNQGVRSRQGMHVAVRGRVIRDRQISRILREALAFALPSGRHPVGLLILEPPPTEVDVNVHPQKCEVRFSDAARVYFALRTVLHRVVQEKGTELSGSTQPPPATQGQGLRQAALLSTIEKAAAGQVAGGAASLRDERPSTAKRSYRLSTRASTPDYDQAKRSLRSQAHAMRQPLIQPSGVEPSGAEPKSCAPAQRGFEWRNAGPAPRPQPSVPASFPKLGDSSPVSSSGAGPHPSPEFEPSFQREKAPEAPVPEQAQEPSPEQVEVLTILPGPVAVCRHKDTLLVADLVSVRSHLILSRLTQQWARRGALDAQALLVPVLLRLSKADVAAYLEHAKALQRLGFELEAFGEGALRVRSLPAVLGVIDEPSEIEAHLAKLRPWLRLLGDSSSPDSALRTMARVSFKDPAPRLARRWLMQLAQDCDLATVPGVQRWESQELLRK